MTAKQKKPASATPKPETLDSQARDFHSLIAESENDVAPLYWRLGGVIEDIRRTRHLDWKATLKHCKGLGLLRARVTRAIRVHSLHKDVRKVTGLSLFKARSRSASPLSCRRWALSMTDAERRTALSFVRRIRRVRPRRRGAGAGHRGRAGREARQGRRAQARQACAEGQEGEAPSSGLGMRFRSPPQPRSPARRWTMKRPIVISFCSGCMGLDLGLEKSGFRVILASEIDRDTVNTIHANRPHLRVIGDLREYTAAQVVAAANIGKKEDIDVVAAGVPCQSFSTAGKRLGLTDPRGKLLLTFARLATDLAPKYIVLENVRGLMSDVAFEKVLEVFRDGGYICSWNLYDACYFGLAQHRCRVVIIASRHGRCPHLAPTHSDRVEDGLPPWLVLRDVIDDMTSTVHHHARYPAWRRKFFAELAPGQNWKDLRNPERAITERVRRATGGKSEFYRRLAWGTRPPTPCSRTPATRSAAAAIPTTTARFRSSATVVSRACLTRGY